MQRTGSAWRAGHQAEFASDETAGVLGHVGRTRHPDVDPPSSQVCGRSPGGGIRARSGVNDQPGPGDLGERCSERLPPEASQGPGPGERHVHREPVCRDAVAHTQRAEERGDDDETSGRAATARGVERWQVEGVVEHALVDLASGSGGGLAKREVAGDLGEEGGRHTQDCVGIRPSAGVGEGVEHGGAGSGESWEGQAAEIEWPPTTGDALGLRRRQQDEHIQRVVGSAD